jgi:eukaryotic-like serine/threonine-protein kinase
MGTRLEMAPQPRSDLLAGRYRRLSSIGVGGMARVLLAEDERLGRQVAVKQLHAAGPEDAALRFEREAKLGASLNHPNLVSIYDIATDDESVLIVMEYVEGTTLQAEIMRGPLAPERVTAIVADVAAGLDHAHSHDVVHRDVKPANILLRRDGVAKLADLGIATAAERTSITRSGVVLGSAAYMAPEQLAGERAGAAADVYALAAVAFEALGGRKARSGKTPIEVAHEVVNDPPPDLRAAWPDAPEAAASLLAGAMDRDPDRRPSSAGALASELERALRQRDDATAATAALAPDRGAGGGRPPVATAARPRRAGASAPAGTRTRRRGHGRRRRLAPTAVLAALAALVLAVVAGASLLGGDEPAGDGNAGQQAGRDGRDSGGAEQEGARGEDDAGSGDPAGESDGGAGASEAAAPPADAEDPAPEPEPAGDPAGLNDEGYRLMQAGDYAGAIPLLEQAVAAYPEGSQELTYAYALYNLGRSLRLAGRAAEAVPILERRLRIPNQAGTVRRELAAARAAS